MLAANDLSFFMWQNKEHLYGLSEKIRKLSNDCTRLPILVTKKSFTSTLSIYE